MKSMIVVIIAVLILVVSVFAIFYNTGDDWETPTEFGKFKEKIIIGFEDGSEETLQIINEEQNNPLNFVTYNNKAIVYAIYIISAIADGEGYTSWEYSSFQVEVYAKDSTGKKVFEANMGNPMSFSGKDNLEFEKAYSLCSIEMDVGVIMSNFPVGEYTFVFHPKDTLEYRGNPSGEWKTVALPSGKQLPITVDESHFINLNLNDDYNIDESLLEMTLQPGNTYDIDITQQMIANTGSNKCENIFASLLPDSEGCFAVFRYDLPDDGQPDGSWIPGEPANAFTTVNADDKYEILFSCSQPDTLIIPYFG